MSVPGKPGNDLKDETRRRGRVGNRAEMTARDPAFQVLRQPFEDAAAQLAEPDGCEFGPVKCRPFNQGAGVIVVGDEGIELSHNPGKLGPYTGHTLSGQGRIEFR